MKKNTLTLAMALIGAVSYSQNVTYVDGYVKSNGTYVEGHFRTVPNNSVNDNFSTYPNVNPFTGETLQATLLWLHPLWRAAKFCKVKNMLVLLNSL